MLKSHVQLSESDKTKLTTLLHHSGLRSKVFKRVTALQELDKGKSVEEVRGILGLSYPTIAKLIKKYKAVQLQCLSDEKQSGHPPQIADSQRAAITALTCSDAPAGYARWSLCLLADKIVELNYCDSISHVQVGRIQKEMQ